MTSLSALEQAVSGCGMTFAPYVTSDLLDLIFTCLGHTNRFVRETGYKTLAAIVKCPGTEVKVFCCCLSRRTGERSDLRGWEGE